MSFVRFSGRLCKRYLQGESNVLISRNEVTIVEQKLLKLSTRMTEFLSTRVDLTADEQVIIIYQLRVILSDISMFSFLLFLSFLLGKWTEFLISLIAMLITRTHIGGIHRETYWGCCAHTLLFFTAVILLADILSKTCFWGIYVVFVIVDIVFAPCPSLERGRFGVNARKRMKLLAVIGVILCGLCGVIVIPEYNNIIMVTLSLVHIEFMLKLTMGRRTNKNA